MPANFAVCTPHNSRTPAGRRLLGSRTASALALGLLLVSPPAQAGTPLLLVADPSQSASDPRVRFWDALAGVVASGQEPGRTPVVAPIAPETMETTPAAMTATTPSPRASPQPHLVVVTPEALDAAVTDTVTSPGSRATFSIHPSNDATIAASKPNAVYGTTPDLRARGGRAEQRGFLEFTVSGAGPAVEQAILRLYCVDGSDDAGHVYAVAKARAGVSPAWSQEELAWNNAPLLEPTPLASLGGVIAGNWLEIDVSRIIHGDGLYSFALVSTAADMVAFAARESNAPPQLVFTTAIRSEEGNTLPVAADDAYTLEEGGALEIASPGLLENDTDADGDLLVLVSSTQPAHGTLVAAGDGSFTYRPEPDYFGPDSFTYVVGDGRFGTRTGTVAITVQPGVAAADPWAAAQKTAAEPETATQTGDFTRIVPNPSRGSTWIEFALLHDARVEAAIYDARGHRVRLLVSGTRPAGRQQLPWDGSNDQGAALPTGVYFLRLQLGAALQTHKIVVQR